MTINRTSARSSDVTSEHDEPPDAQTLSSSAGVQPSTLAADDGPLRTLTRSKSLPARLDATSSAGVEVTRPRRRIGQGASGANTTAVEQAEAPAAQEHRVNIDDAGESPSPSAGGARMPLASPALRAVKAFAKMSDVRTLLRQADDREFISGLRAPSSDEATDGARLDRLTDHVNELKANIGAAGLDDALAARFTTRLDEVGSTLNALRTDRPLHERVAKITALNVLLAPLPLIIPLMTKPRQQKTEAEISALMAKAMIEGIGLIRTPTTDNNLLKDRAMARYYANMVQALEFALPTFVGSLRFLNGNAAFNVVAGTISTGALFGGFLSKEIRERYNVWRTGSAHPGLHQAGLALSRETKAALEAVRAAVEIDRTALNDTKAAFVENDRRELSPHVSKQVAIAVNAYQRLADELAACIGLPPEQTPRENRDFSAKLALALFSTAVCAATTILMVPDTIGTVDLASDAAFTSALMFSLMADKNVGRQDALEEFKTFVGLSLVMLAVLAANKMANDFIEHGVPGLLVGSIAMTALNLTMPGPVGHSAAQAIETLMSKKPADFIAGIKRIGGCVYEMLGGQPHPPSVSSVRIEELAPDVEGALPA